MHADYWLAQGWWLWIQWMCSNPLSFQVVKGRTNWWKSRLISMWHLLGGGTKNFYLRSTGDCCGVFPLLSRSFKWPSYYFGHLLGILKAYFMYHKGLQWENFILVGIILKNFDSIFYTIYSEILMPPQFFKLLSYQHYPLYVLCTKGLSHPYMCDLEPKHLFLWNNIASKAFIITESYLKMKK